MGQIFIENVSAGVSVTGRVVADTAFTCTGAGDFKVYMASGTTGTLTGTNILPVGFVNLIEGLNLISTSGAVADGNIDITIGTAANTNTTASWSAASGGKCTASVPSSTNSAYFDANSFTAGSQVLTVNADLNVLDIDWTNATNTPSLSITGGYHLHFYGNLTFIAAMTLRVAGADGRLHSHGAGAIATLNGQTLVWHLYVTAGDLTLAGTTNTGVNELAVDTAGGELKTNNQTVSCGALYSTGVSTFTFGSSTINCTSFGVPAGGIVTTNTSTINVSGVGGFSGGTIVTYNNVALLGTAHTLTGNFTCVNLTFTGTATTTDTRTLTADQVITVTGTFTATGNSTTNRLSILTTVAGTHAHINAANVAVTKCKIKDIAAGGAGSWAYGATDDVLHVSGCTGMIFRLFWKPTAGSGSGNISATTSWKSVSGGAVDCIVVPSTTTRVYFDANSFGAVGQTVTIDSGVNFLSMDWTGSTNTPAFVTSGVNYLRIYEALTLIAAMTVTGLATILWCRGTGTVSITCNGKTLPNILIDEGAAVSFLDNATVCGIELKYGGIQTNDKTVTVTVGYDCSGFETNGALLKTVSFGSSIINANGWVCQLGSNVTFSVNTATINITTAGTVGLNTYNYNGASFNLNSTSHTVSGSPTGINIFTRTGTATNANSITFTSGTTITCTTFAMIGNSRANQLHVLTTTMGSPVTITATNVTGTNNADFMDIAMTNAVDFSAAGLNILTIGNGGGCTGITFPATLGTATYANGGTNKASEVGRWDIGRIPLVGIDDVVIPTGQTCNNDMPRFGKSLTTVGTAVLTLSQDTSFYGSFSLSAGCTFTYGAFALSARGRGNFSFTTANKDFNSVSIYMPTGTLTLADASTQGDSVFLYNGTLIFGANWTLWQFTASGTTSVNLSNYIITITSTAAAQASWSLASTVTLNAGTSTIVLSNFTANAKTFAGGGLTYNNVTVTGAGNYALTVTGNNVFKTLTIDASVVAKTLTGTAGSVQTGTLVCISKTKNQITLNSTGAAWTLTGQVGYFEGDFMSITNVVAGKTNTYYAANSTDNGGNTNWIFKRKVRYVMDTKE